MQVNLATVDAIINAHLVANTPATLLYVPRGQRQPNDADNPSHLPWYSYRLRASTVRRQIGLEGSGEPHRMQLQVICGVFCPAAAIVANSYALHTGMDLVMRLLLERLLTDSPETHRVLIDSVEMESEFGVQAGGGEGGAGQEQGGSVIFTGVAECLEEPAPDA